MKLSTKSRYGSRAMLDMACYYGKGPLLLKSIAKRQEISTKYLEQIIMPLKAAGLVRSIRGSRGGYILARPPDQIKLYDIIDALEGKICLVDCVNHPELCQRVEFCATRDIWSQLSSVLNKILSSTTLADLVKKLRSKPKFQENQETEARG